MKLDYQNRKTNELIFMKMKSTYLAISLLTLIGMATSTNAADPVNVAGESGIALSGYDAVAFQTEKKPVHGDPSITAEHNGATYMFANKANQKAFSENPEKYAPQFGGFCAYGVAVGALFPVDISTWQVQDGKLYLNLNPAILEVFNKDLDGNITKAEKNWPKLGK